MTQKAKVSFDVKNASQSQLLTLSSEAIERVQRDVTGREIQALKDYEKETSETLTNGQVGVLSAKKLRAIQEAKTAMILNTTPSEIPLLKSADEPITTIDA